MYEKHKGSAKERADVEASLAVRTEAAKDIDPQTAEVTWWIAATHDPYGLYYDLPYKDVGKLFFACAPGSDIWVSFQDLPDATRSALSKRISIYSYWPTHWPKDPFEC
jgi:hypothetical protein